LFGVRLLFETASHQASRENARRSLQKTSDFFETTTDWTDFADETKSAKRTRNRRQPSTTAAKQTFGARGGRAPPI
jgi:hypothetical protein